jgi:hypothetical protein
MPDPQIRAVVVPLTPEQREDVFQASGSKVTEVVFVARLAAGPPLENEVAVGGDGRLFESLIQGTDEIVTLIGDQAEAKALWEEYTSHGIYEKKPPLVLLR